MFEAVSIIDMHSLLTTNGEIAALWGEDYFVDGEAHLQELSW